MYKDINLVLKKGSTTEYKALPKAQRLEIYKELLKLYTDNLFKQSGLCNYIERNYIINGCVGNTSTYGISYYVPGVIVLFDGGLPELRQEYYDSNGDQ